MMKCLSQSQTIVKEEDHHLPRLHQYEKAIKETDEDEMQKRLSDLRREIADAKVDWYVVPAEDEHQSEYIGEPDERRRWISGFNGSAGAALIPSSAISANALLFTDSRYWVQAEGQVPKKGWKVIRSTPTGKGGIADISASWTNWLITEAGEGMRIGIDPKLIGYSQVAAIQTNLATKYAKFIPLTTNLVDRARDLPPRSLGPIKPHSLKFAGETSSSKLAKLRKTFDSRSNGSGWIYVLPTLPAIAWLLNFRCTTDVPHCPVAYTYLVLTKTKCVLFVDERKVQDEDLKTQLDSTGVEIRPYGVGQIEKCVKECIEQIGELEGEKKKVRVWSPRECSWALAEVCGKDKIEILYPCPVESLKAIKNSTERQGFRNAYLRDGRAMVRWMAWLEQKILKDERAVGEWAAAQALVRFRNQEDFFAGLAYESVSGSGPNGALPHYAPERGSDRVIDPDATYVIDTGSQYLDGTIDTTRTLYLGKSPSEDVKRAYTRVLQAHMGTARSTFPRGFDSIKLSMLGKEPLFRDGLDFGHGLGHGIGSYLNVHEYPSSFPSGFSFEPGHIITIEPGFYNEGHWGIRTESVYICQSVDTKYNFGGKVWLGWERVTQVPIQTSLVDWSLMTKDEIRWLNDHNTSVENALMPLLQSEEDKDVREWLKKACVPKKIWPWTGA